MKRKKRKQQPKAMSPALRRILNPPPLLGVRDDAPRLVRVELPVVPPRMLRQAPDRDCGACQACCTVSGVVDLGKPYYVRCEHQKGGRCGCYQSRPEECRAFACAYLAGDLPADPAYRPDQLGVMINVELDESLSHISTWWLTIYETREGGAGDVAGDHLLPRPDILQLIARFLRAAPACKAVRFVLFNTRVPIQYEIKPPYPDEGEVGYDWGRLYIGPDPQPGDAYRVVRLHAPLRDRTEPLAAGGDERGPVV